MRQPKLHMSMGKPQVAPRMTSGARQNRDWMYMKVASCSNMLVPKSINLMPVLDLFLSSTFSGLMSEWMMPFSFKKTRALSIWIANVLICGVSMGWNRFSSIRSYRLMLSSSVTMQMCFRKTMKSLILTIFFSLSMSFSLVRIKMLIQFRASCMCSFFDLIILMATVYLFLWSKALTTSPNAPLPRHSSSSYRYPTCSCLRHMQVPSRLSSPGPAPTPMQQTVFQLISSIFWFQDRIGANLWRTFLPESPGSDPRKVYSSRKLLLFAAVNFFLGAFITSEVFFLTWVPLVGASWARSLAGLGLLDFLDEDGFLLSRVWMSRLCSRCDLMGSRSWSLAVSWNSRKECSQQLSGSLSRCRNSVFSRKKGFLFLSHRLPGLLRLGSNLSFILIYIIDYTQQRQPAWRPPRSGPPLSS